MNLKQIENQVSALLADQKSLIADKRRSWSAKSAEYDNRQKDIDALLDQYKSQKSVSGSGFDYLAMSASAGSSFASSSKAYGDAALDGPPSLAVSDEDAQRLFLAAKSGQMLKVDTKAATTSTGLGGTPVQYIPGFAEFLREPTRIASLMPTVAASSSTVDYYVLSGSASAAAVTEGTTKPESTVAATLKTLSMSKIATWARATSEVLADFPAFMNVLQSDLAAGVVLQESSQILNGSGVAPNMTGILNTSGLLTQVTTAGTDPLVALSTAATALRNGSSYVNPTGIVMNPTDLGKIRTLKASGSGEFIAGDPFASGPTTVWGIPVTTTTAIAAGTALMADFSALGTVFVRDGLSITVDPYSQMTDNVTRVVAEERLAVAVIRPSAGIKITGLNS